jgi:hypothetical protein
MGVEDDAYETRAPVDRAAPRGRGRQAIVVIGGVVAIGVLIVLIIVMIGALTGNGGVQLPGAATETPVATPTEPATNTPVPTETATPTREVPEQLSLPGLDCIYQSGQGCYDYCAEPGHVDTCNAARAFLDAEGVDPDAWFNCFSPGPGLNQGDALDCLEQAWRVRNP